MGKGDPLCPLGFHPQVRWPTRCKRCFRDYKEHIGKNNEEAGSGKLRKDDVTSSSPALSDFDLSYQRYKDKASVVPSSLNVRSASASPSPYQSYERRPSLESSAIAGSTNEKFASKTNPEADQLRLSKSRPSSWSAQDISKLDDRKLNGNEKDYPSRPHRRIQVQSFKEVTDSDSKNSADVEFILRVKSSKDDNRRGSLDDDLDSISAFTETTDTTETTLIDCNVEGLQDQIASLKKEVETARIKCDRLEKENSELSKKSEGKGGKVTATEVLRLTQKLHEVETKNEDLADEKKVAELKVKELEKQLSTSRNLSVQALGLKSVEEVKKKLTAAEHLVEELMEENEELKKEMTIMAQEMDELHDNFREDQADEYRDLKKELEQTAKNCRILQFKLRKAERRVEQVEAEKVDLENRLQEKLNKSSEYPDDDASHINMLEQELAMARDISLQMQEELQSLQKQLSPGKDSASTFKREFLVPSATAPHLIKSRSLEGPGLRRQASEESQYVRDLQDCLEREADLREQLKFAEEESQSLRKKVSRLEEENESLVMQLKKMAGKKVPVVSRRAESSLDKDEGISDDLDLNDLRLQLELNEQETSVLRRKLEEHEAENEKLTNEISKMKNEMSSTQKPEITVTPPADRNDYYEQKMAVLEDEMKQVRLRLIEKERDVERLETELIAAQKAKSKVAMQRSRSLDSESTVDLKRQLQAIEQEYSVLRQRTIDLENDCEKIQSENRRLQLRVSRRPTTALPPSEQLHIENEDLKEQLKTMEKRLSEANSKVKELSEKQESPRASRTGKYLALNNGELDIIKREKELVEKELRTKEDDIFALKTKLKELGEENKSLSDKVKTVINTSRYKSRTPKKVTDLTTKNSLKKMVDDQEREIWELISALSTLEERTKVSIINDDEISKEDLNSLKEELETLTKEKVDLLEAKVSLEAKLTVLEADINKLRNDSEELRKLQNNINELEKQLKLEKAQHSETKQKLQSGSSVDIEQLQKVRQEKHKLQKELLEKDASISELEKKLKDTEEKIKRRDSSTKEQKEKILTLEKELETEKTKLKDCEIARKELKDENQREKDEAKEQLTSSKNKIADLENSIIQKEKKFKEMELTVKEEAKRFAEVAMKKAEKEIKLLKDELQSTKIKAEDLEQKLYRSESDKRTTVERYHKQEEEWKKERDQLISRNNNIELELKAEKKKRDRMEREHEQEEKERSDEIISLKEKIKRLDNDLKSANEKYEEINNRDSRGKDLELKLEKQRQEYEDLTSKYEMLEEEYVVTKAKLTMESEQVENDFILIKREYDQINGELRALRDTYNFRQDTWIKEKLQMQEKLRELEEKLSRSAGDASSTQRLRDIIEEKKRQMERTKEESNALQDQLSIAKREADDLRKKLEDFDKVSKVQRNMTVDTTELEKEVLRLRSCLSHGEKSHRAELAQLKMKFDQRLALMNEEIQTMQLQVDKFKRERDTFKEILDGAQKMMSELRADPSRKKDSASDIKRQREIEDTHQRLQEFHCQITNLEDELTEARMEASKVKTEYINEKSEWEIKVAELQTRINELEEDRIMSAGRSRIPGMKSRLEIAWQKEREDLTRIVSENSALAKDLRQTLFEVRVQKFYVRLYIAYGSFIEYHFCVYFQLQFDLLELRDAHAKLRTSCEKLKRDKEKVERDREQLHETIQNRHKKETEEEKKLLKLIDDVQKVRDLSPLVLGEYLTSESQKDTKSKDAPGGKVKNEFIEALRKINRTTEDLKKYHRLDLSADYDPMKRRTGEPSETKSSKKLQSYKRSQSLEQNQAISELEKQEVQQSKQVLTASPYAGIRGRSVTPGLLRERDSSIEDYRFLTLPGRRSASARRETSEDRLSDFSTTSEIIPLTPETKKKKGIVGKLKQFTKSKSIEASGTADIIVGAGIQALAAGVGTTGSDLSLDSATSRNTEKEKKSVKDRLTGFFKKGSSSRNQSMESDDGSDISEISTRSSSRLPAVRISGSASNLSGTLPMQKLRSKPPLPDTKGVSSPTAEDFEIEKLENSPRSSRHLTPGYEPSMSPAGYSALLSASSGDKRRQRQYGRSHSATGLRTQGSFETNV
ncbi:centrosomal protein of 290 kDa-like [Artemia franciscana]|uniref:centrosomal protein of 290 kDa-like n=1 Tax=Artemia franciscana TaxID=6661 RepID=UPI0032DBF029